MLDTAADGGAAALYERLGFNLAGMIPGYALKPHGRIGEKAEQAASQRVFRPALLYPREIIK
ncbi:hypothetical protein [Deinococcus aluminii]|uniref:GNAT family N-acetyltransferase n=1 Tax=Deinococcus aluminii TaxID=1656885 RepID=A0ABP9XB17_9DEIO